MKLEEMSMKELLTLHNEIADNPVGPKTFATRSKLLARIEALAEAKNINLASFRRPESTEVTESRTQLKADAAETAEAATKAKKKRGNRVGELARSLIMDPAGFPHGLIASRVNAERPGAAATAKSIRWYACKMRKDGTQVPERQKSYPAEMDAEHSAE